MLEATDKTFRTCPECTTDPSQPYMVIASRWNIHQKGRRHGASLRLLRGKKQAMTGPEVEAKRLERKQRKRQGSSSSVISSDDDRE